jgi:peptide/nickel transport system permease protein
MARVVAKRLLQVVPTLLLATIVVFVLQHLVPGGPANAIAGEYATPERIASINSQLGLDDPVLVQYWNWLTSALRADLGTSLATGQPVMELIEQRLPATLTLGFAAMSVSIIVGVPLGIAGAVRRGRRSDGVITGIATLGVAIPNFWLGMMFVLLFGIQLKWLPATGFVPISEDPIESFRHVLLPALALGGVGAAEICRQLRSAMIEVLDSDFIRTHRAKGLAWSRIVWVHGLKNAGLPLATIIGLRVSRVMGAAVVVETLFAIPGIGTLVTMATSQRDYPVIQGVVLLSAVVVLVTNLIVDLAYRLIDPRIASDA